MRKRIAPHLSYHGSIRQASSGSFHKIPIHAALCSWCERGANRQDQEAGPHLMGKHGGSRCELDEVFESAVYYRSLRLRLD